MTTPDLDAIRKEWATPCGSCDYGLPYECTCSTGDPRPIVSILCDEVEQWKLTADRLREQRDLMRGYRDAAEQLAQFRQGVNDSLRQDLSDAGDVIAAVRESAERLDRALAGRLPSLPDIRAAVEHIDRALAAYDRTA